jgi:hypothetical protein
MRNNVHSNMSACHEPARSKWFMVLSNVFVPVLRSLGVVGFSCFRAFVPLCFRAFVSLCFCAFVLVACESGNGNDPNDTPGVDVTDDKYTPPDGEELDVNAEISDPDTDPDVELLDCGNGICEPEKGENLLTCIEDCQNQGDCGNFICEPDKFEDYLTCSNDCEELEHCGDGDCNYQEECINCPADCGCEKEQVCIQPVEGQLYVCSDVEDPLEPYYWIEGEWKCTEGTIQGNTYTVTIEGWDTKLGANVNGFSPCIGYAMTTENQNEFTFSGKSQSGKVQCFDGIITNNDSTLTFSAKSDTTPTTNFVYVKQ